MSDSKRAKAKEIAGAHLRRGDFVGWFDVLYGAAGEDAEVIPWAGLAPHAALRGYLSRVETPPGAKRALVVGCGLGDDAEELATRGWDVTSFDISENAIAWCRKRFPESAVRYEAADLFDPPAAWSHGFDFVYEGFTIQNFREALRRTCIARIASFVAPGGQLLVVTNGREEDEPLDKIPWPLARSEIETLRDHGLEEVSFEEAAPDPNQPGRIFVAVWRRA